MSRARWWRPLVPPLLAVAVLVTGSAATALAASYPASIDVNTSGFNPPCDGDANLIVPKMQTAAKAAYARLGHLASAFTGAAFTRAATLKRTPSDWGYYVHSHGDYYLNGDGRRYTGFREDSGDCSQAVIFSKDIAAKRLGRASNLVFVSTCHAADANTTMPGGPFSNCWSSNSTASGEVFAKIGTSRIERTLFPNTESYKASYFSLAADHRKPAAAAIAARL